MTLRHLLLPTGYALLAVTATLGVVTGESAAEDADPTTRAVTAWSKNCTKCHSNPDPVFETDRAFLRQITETSWTGTPAEAREALIEYLSGDAVARPTTVAAAPAAPDPETGIVTSDIGHGELLLQVKGDATRRYRLRWDPDARGARALPPGTYVLTGYRQVATQAKDGAQWIWTTTSPGYRELTVEKGAAVHVDVLTKLKVRARAFQAKGGQHRVGLLFQAEEKLGNTLYRDGARITITWQCLDAEGAVLAEGKMDYGWGGGAGAAVQPPEGTTQARFVFPDPPFEIEGQLTVPFVMKAERR